METLYERNQRFFLIGICKLYTIYNPSPFNKYFLFKDSFYRRFGLCSSSLDDDTYNDTNAAPNTPEEYYTQRLTSTRSIIERVNGVLKMRFRCLIQYRALQYAPAKVAKIVKACCVLHNMCIRDDIPVPDMQLNEEQIGLYPIAFELDEVRGNRLNPDLAAGKRIQQQIITQLWIRRQALGNFRE